MLATPAAGGAIRTSVWMVVCSNLRLSGLSTVRVANASPGTTFASVRILSYKPQPPPGHAPPHHVSSLCSTLLKAAPVFQGISGRTNVARTVSMVKAYELPRRCAPHSLTASRIPQCRTARWQRHIFTCAPLRAVTAVTADTAPTASEATTAADDQVSPAKRRARKVTQEEGAVVKRKTTRKPAAKAKASKSAQPAAEAIDNATAGTGLRTMQTELHAARVDSGA